MKIFSLCTIGIILLFATACQTDPPPPADSQTAEDIVKQLEDQEDVRGGLNPFRLIENPLYSAVEEAGHLRDNDMVFITKADGEVKVYPHRHMHVEVVNEEANGVLMAITYCPITRSGINWNRLVGADTLLLTASGYLYRENLMPLYVNTGNIWSQMLMRRFQGTARQGDLFAFRELNTFPMIETTWLTVKDHFPQARVYVNNSGSKSAGSAPLEQQLGIIQRESVQLFTMDMFPGEIVLHETV
ncbi:MAG: DUF3179 domain-containing (seleno)protein [Bacteroidales bacterium]|nr:DUF3179 domain-containing (seleno)protein [Bacteroidales bacterium]